MDRSKLKEEFILAQSFKWVKSIVTWPHVLGQNIMVGGAYGGDLFIS